MSSVLDVEYPEFVFSELLLRTSVSVDPCSSVSEPPILESSDIPISFSGSTSPYSADAVIGIILNSIISASASARDFFILQQIDFILLSSKKHNSACIVNKHFGSTQYKRCFYLLLILSLTAISSVVACR